MVVDAFYDFTRAERELLARAALAGCGLQIALTLDPADEARAASSEPIDETDPFRRPITTYRRLRETFTRLGVRIDPTVALRAP